MNAIEIEKQRKLDYALTFGSDQGRNVLADLANRFNMFAAHTIGDPIILAYEEGQRSVVLEIIKAAATDFEDRKRQILEELKHGR